MKYKARNYNKPDTIFCFADSFNIMSKYKFDGMQYFVKRIENKQFNCLQLIHYLNIYLYEQIQERAYSEFYFERDKILA